MAASVARVIVLGAALIGCMAVAPSATPEPGYSAQAGRPCFTPREVANFRQGEGGAIYVRVRISEVFELSADRCANRNISTTMMLRPDGPSEQLCVNDTARLTAGGAATIPFTCEVRIARKLTPEQIDALPDSVRP